MTRGRGARSSAGGALVVLVVGALGAACSGDDESGEKKDPPPDLGSPEWAQFGHDQANSRANRAETAITTATVPTLVRKWDVAEAGGTAVRAITGTPAVVGGVVYWGNWAGRVTATRVTDGSEAWSTDVGASVDGSALVADGRVYVGDADGFVHALDQESGRILWSNPVETSEGGHIYSSPSRAGDHVVVGTGNSPNSGQQTFRGRLVALDPAEGTLVWDFDVTRFGGMEYGPGVSLWSSPAVDPSRKAVYIGTGQGYAPPASPLSDSIVAVDYETGQYLWHRQFHADDVFTFEMLFSRPNVTVDRDVGAAPNLWEVDGRAFVGAGDKSGQYYALDRDTGELVWGTELTGGTFIGGVMMAAAYHDGVVYVSSNDWGQFGVSPVPFTHEKNFCATFALDARDAGRILWRQNVPSTCIGGVAWAAGVVYVEVSSGKLHALDAVDGEFLFEHQLGVSSAGGVTISNGMVFGGSGWSFGTFWPGDMGGSLVGLGLP